jgi:hypothetical protein
MRYKFFPLIFIGFFFLTGYIVMFLWNAILPEVTSAHPVSYWQAMGLLVLCRILFGGFRTPGSRHFGKNRRTTDYWRKKWGNMTEEERDHIRQKWMGSDREKNC